MRERERDREREIERKRERERERLTNVVHESVDAIEPGYCDNLTKLRLYTYIAH